MNTPSYTFRLKDAAQRTEPKIFVDLLIETGKFYRNEKSQIMYQVSPGDYCLLERKHDLAQLIADGDVIAVDGDLGETCDGTLWIWLTARKFSLPRLNPHIPFQRPNPAEEHRKTYQATLRAPVRK
jgi:hypothetical protein